MKLKKLKLRITGVILLLFIGANVVAYFHAYKFTHFDLNPVVKTTKPEELSFVQKVKTLVFGVSNPKPKNVQFPIFKFETVHLKSNTQIECWRIKAGNPKGTVLLFHGFSGEKSSMLDKANEFLALNYSVMLVDFMGSGGSEGSQTTIGFKEAHDVKVTVEYLKNQGEENIVLFGNSMGAVAIMKALNDHKLPVSKVILECPFGSMLQTVKSRFSTMGIPSFPMAHFLMFWGGIQNGFNAYDHNPIDYASNIHHPTLILYGVKDIKVSKQEIDAIFNNLQGEKYLKCYQKSGHENYLIKHKKEWQFDVREFLNQATPG